MKLLQTLGAITLLSCFGYSTPTKADQEELVLPGWQFEFEPYIFLSTINGNAKLGIAPNTELHLDFSTIVDKLRMAGMFHFEAHHSTGFGVSLNYGFMDLGAKKTNKIQGTSSVDIRQGIFELLALYRVTYGVNKLDYFTGIRWWDNDLSLSVSATEFPPFIEIEKDEDWVDLILGVRWIKTFNKKWAFVSRADTGGFGLTSDFTSTVELGAIYYASETVILNMKYKSSWVDYDNDKAGKKTFRYDTVTHGPMLGLRVLF